jgi:hypothetical protein
MDVRYIRDTNVKYMHPAHNFTNQKKKTLICNLLGLDKLLKKNFGVVKPAFDSE